MVFIHLFSGLLWSIFIRDFCDILESRSGPDRHTASRRQSDSRSPRSRTAFQSRYHSSRHDSHRPGQRSQRSDRDRHQGGPRRTSDSRSTASEKDKKPEEKKNAEVSDAGVRCWW